MSFVWLLICNRSDDGLIDKPKLVTCKYVNFVVHDGGLVYIFNHFLCGITDCGSGSLPHPCVKNTCGVHH
jgi:hypothetical protein